MKSRRKSVYFLKEEEDEEPAPKKRKLSGRTPSSYRVIFNNNGIFQQINHDYAPDFNFNQNRTGSVKFMSNEPSCKVSTPFPISIEKEAVLDSCFDICLERPKKHEEMKGRIKWSKSNYAKKKSKFVPYLSLPFNKETLYSRNQNVQKSYERQRLPIMFIEFS